MDLPISERGSFGRSAVPLSKTLWHRVMSGKVLDRIERGSWEFLGRLEG